MFDHISKHLELRQKFANIFNPLLSVWRCGQAHYFDNLYALNKYFYSAKIVIIFVNVYYFWLMSS